ncbi:hypothetical protein D3C81_632180 [compost metagenome]
MEHMSRCQRRQRNGRGDGQMPVRIVLDRQQAFALQHLRQRLAPRGGHGQRRRVLAGGVEVDQARATFPRPAGQRLRAHAVFVALHRDQPPSQCGGGLQQARIHQAVAEDRIALAPLAEQNRGQRHLCAFGQQQARVVHRAQHRLQPARRRVAIGRIATAEVIGHQVRRIAAREHRRCASTQHVRQCIGVRYRRHVHAEIDGLIKTGLGRCDEAALRPTCFDQSTLACFIEGTGHRGQVHAQLLCQCALRGQPLPGRQATAIDGAFQRVDDAQVDRTAVHVHVLHPAQPCDARPCDIGSRHVRRMSGRIVASNGGSLSITIGRFGQVTAVVVCGGCAGQRR